MLNILDALLYSIDDSQALAESVLHVSNQTCQNEIFVTRRKHAVTGNSLSATETWRDLFRASYKMSAVTRRWCSLSSTAASVVVRSDLLRLNRKMSF